MKSMYRDIFIIFVGKAKENGESGEVDADEATHDALVSSFLHSCPFQEFQESSSITK